MNYKKTAAAAFLATTMTACTEPPNEQVTSTAVQSWMSQTKDINALEGKHLIIKEDDLETGVVRVDSVTVNENSAYTCLYYKAFSFKKLGWAKGSSHDRHTCLPRQLLEQTEPEL